MGHATPSLIERADPSASLSRQTNRHLLDEMHDTNETFQLLAPGYTATRIWYDAGREALAPGLLFTQDLPSRT